jgi:uncharacterized protein (UPF0303 family)
MANAAKWLSVSKSEVSLMEPQQELQQVVDQEAKLIFPQFDASTAWEIGTALREAARARGGAITIDIRQGDEILFFHAMPGTTPANADWARRKRNLVELLRRSSYAIGLECRIKNTNIVEKMDLPARDYVFHGGCFPIKVAGAGHIGTITVSGLPQRTDHNLIISVVAKLLGHDVGPLEFD